MGVHSEEVRLVRRYENSLPICSRLRTRVRYAFDTVACNVRAAVDDPPQRGRADIALRYDIGGGGQGTTIADAGRINRQPNADRACRESLRGRPDDGSPSIEFCMFDDDGRISEMRVFTDDAVSAPWAAQLAAARVARRGAS
jgi:hypothetical protein